MLNENKDFYETMSLEKMNQVKNDIMTKLKISATNKREENFQMVKFIYFIALNLHKLFI